MNNIGDPSAPIQVRILPEPVSPARILISLGVTVGMCAVAVWVQRALMKPDVMLTLRMRAARTVAETAWSGSRALAKVGVAADKVYLAQRSA